MLGHKTAPSAPNAHALRVKSHRIPTVPQPSAVRLPGWRVPSGHPRESPGTFLRSHPPPAPPPLPGWRVLAQARVVGATNIRSLLLTRISTTAHPRHRGTCFNRPRTRRACARHQPYHTTACEKPGAIDGSREINKVQDSSPAATDPEVPLHPTPPGKPDTLPGRLMQRSQGEGRMVGQPRRSAPSRRQSCRRVRMHLKAGSWTLV